MLIYKYRMAQNRYYNAMEDLWDAVRTETNPATSLRLKRLIQPLFEFPNGVLVTSPTHPCHLFGMQSVETNRRRLKHRCEQIIEEDLEFPIRLMFREDESSSYIALTEMLYRFRMYSLSLVDSDSDSD